MIGSFGELARSGGDARIICDIDLQKGRFFSCLGDLIRRFATGVLITRMPSEWNTSSKPPPNFESRSWMSSLKG